MRVVLGPPPLMRCIPLRLWLSIREMNEQLEKHGIAEDTTKEGVWTRKDKQGGPQEGMEVV